MDRHRHYFGVSGRQAYPFMDLNDPHIDYVQVSRGFGVPARRVVEPQQIGPAVQEAFKSGGPYLIELLTGQA
jgi:thiamine pyrophosphate-dependent acetolactate synthase large subunit-like protein